MEDYRELTKEEVRLRYDNFARWYDLSEGVVELSGLGRLRRKLLSNVRGKVLDVGLGTGKNLKYYPRNCEINALDFSYKMLEVAKRKATRFGGKVEFCIGDAENMPFEDGSFDTVVDSLGLCTYNNPVKALMEMKRVCRKKGRILLLEHGIGNRNWVWELQRWREHKHYERLGCSLLRNPVVLVGQAGLKIEEFERYLLGIIYYIIAKK